MRARKFIIKTVMVIAVFIVFVGNHFLPATLANQVDKEADNQTKKENPEEPLNVGRLIISHVVNSHEWHFMTLSNGTEIAIYFPMILFHEGQLYCFSSRHLYHSETHSYKGFELDESDKVLFRNQDGTLSESSVYDFSITKVAVGIFISCILLAVIFIRMARMYVKRGMKAPKGLWNAFEMGIIFVRDTIAKPSIAKNHEKYMPFLLTAFFFIFFNNLIGQIPGWANVTGNIAVTLVLALCTFVITAFSGNKHYWKEIFNPDVPMLMKFPLPLMPFIEFFGMLTKPFALTMRLFANITAGHIVMLGFTCLIFLLGAKSVSAGYISSVLSVFLSVFMYVLELLIAFIQAFIFTLLSAIYIGLATEEPHKQAH